MSSRQFAAQNAEAGHSVTKVFMAQRSMADPTLAKVQWQYIDDKQKETGPVSTADLKASARSAFSHAYDSVLIGFCASSLAETLGRWRA